MDLTQLRITPLQEKAIEYALLANGIETTEAEKVAWVQRWLDDYANGYVSKFLSWSAVQNPAPSPTPEQIAAEQTAKEELAVTTLEAAKVAFAEKKAAELEAANQTEPLTP